MQAEDIFAVSDIEDNNDAWWHQIELENQERFEEAVKRHERVNEESRRLLIELLKPERSASDGIGQRHDSK